ncbi:16S rRNA pseudouridine516 synthase [Okibacterium fritillariae]|uniref:Pseudouridine synthase n=1 Tax=Okibacterium fritillariae TaxID=123320 RepID=A0A1T5JUK1_9MICO|nr:16S rRNA pseudouridine516 synthase [Okibacterium fritillariae]
MTFADHNGTDDETAGRADTHQADAAYADAEQTSAERADAEQTHAGQTDAGQTDAERGDARDYADVEVDVELDGSSFGEYYDEDDEEYDAEAAERKAAIVEHTGVRLQKVMASSGVASRRVSEDMIAAGRVRVNGEVVREPGRRVDPEKDEILVDGTAVQADTSKRYIMLNKPVGIYSSLRDERGRPDLSRYTDEFEERLFNVGRLDAETSGLLILTNDGDMAHVLAHPSFGVTKMYIAKVEGRMTPQTIARLTKGLDLEDGFIAADKARLLDASADGTSLVEVTLHSGRNRIVRRMLDEVGHPVIDLVRRRFGPLHLGTLAPGQMRDLTKVEMSELLTISRQAAKDTPAGDAADANTDDANTDASADE